MLRGLSYTAASFLIFFARARQAGSGTMAGPVTCGCDWVRCGRVGLRRTARSTAPPPQRSVRPIARPEPPRHNVSQCDSDSTHDTGVRAARAVQPGTFVILYGFIFFLQTMKDQSVPQ
jgi:hypothetical protein